MIDKVYKRKILEIAWKRVKTNRGSGGVDGESVDAFAEQLDERLDQLHAELRTNTYRPRPVNQTPIPKAGKPDEHRLLGIPTVYDRVCQQALLQRLEPMIVRDVVRIQNRLNVQAAVGIEANDDEGRERLCRYCARPSFALDRISQFSDGRIA
ncbi:hypothetical protein WME73_36120 [Sorangium sp. So ce302]|uniref:hypothetical protein n=1 Tax=Sorangium sp. So ce302 TaxID=3133297 RepID=UPI003F6369E4